MQDNLLRVCKCIILSLESKRSLLTPKQAGGICEEAQPVSSPRRRGNTLSWRSLRLEIDHTLRRSCRWKFDQRKFYCQKKKKKKKKKLRYSFIIISCQMHYTLPCKIVGSFQTKDDGLQPGDSRVWPIPLYFWRNAGEHPIAECNNIMLFSLELILYCELKVFNDHH